MMDKEKENSEKKKKTTYRFTTIGRYQESHKPV